MTRQFKVTVNGREYDVAVLEVTPGAASSAPLAHGSAVESSTVTAPVTRSPASVAVSTPEDEVAQMGGVVVQVDVTVGQTVAHGDRLLVLEAMKMKNHLLASRAGRVTRVMVSAGDAVEGGQPLLTIQ